MGSPFVEQGKKRTSVVRIVIFLAVGTALAVGVYFAPGFFTKEKEERHERLKIGGTSVAAMIIDNKWRTEYRKEKAIDINYDSKGSTKGLTEMIDKHYTIGFTHAPMTEEQKKQARSKGGEVIHIPVVLCAVVAVYNVKELNGKAPLRFDADLLAKIFLGKIEKWDDPALKRLNPGVDLPDTPIKVAFRSDSSGTTLIFADYLHGASDLWKKEGGPVSSELKLGSFAVGKSRNQGVGDYVRETEGAIGYVDLLYVRNGVDPDLMHGAIENKEGKFIHVQADNMTAAAKATVNDIPEDLTFNLTNKSGPETYPICGAIWAVCYQDQPAAEYQKIVDFLSWITHEGQKYAEYMTYAPLPPELVRRAEQKLKTIKSQ
jgi:phosphate transport system substrate-binding protein